MTESKAAADKPAEKAEYVATDTIRFGIHAGYHAGDPVPADVVKNNPDETDGKVKKA
jgi:hypothetical protein